MTKSPAPSNPTALLLAWGRGDQAAFDELVPLVHEELRQIARQHMGHERARRFRKRGGGVAMGLMDEALVVSNERHRDLVELDDALNALAAVDPRKSQVIEMRYFGGLSVEETADVLHVSPGTSCGIGDWPKCGFSPC